MRSATPSRFKVVRMLRETRSMQTFVGLDVSNDNETVLVKIFRRRHVEWERSQVDRILWLFRGIRHPHLVPILDSGLTADGDFYVVREFLPQLEFPRKHLLDDIKSLISTFAFLHSNGHVHGAIKPTNLFGGNEHFRVADPRMGVVRAVHSEEEIRFVAPEVLDGGKVTIESDLYSIGALLYRWVVGQDTFNDLEINQLKLKCMWASPQQIEKSPDIAKNLSRAIIELLHKDPRKRVTGLRSVIAAVVPESHFVHSRTLHRPKWRSFTIFGIVF